MAVQAAWEDRREDTWEFPRIDIHGARISEEGLLLDPEGIPLSVTVHGQKFPALAALRGRYLFAYQSPHTDGALRLRARLLTFDEHLHWSNQDIGPMANPGGAVFMGGQALLRGAGSGFSGNSDNGHFLSQPATGDGYLLARIDAIDSHGPDSRAGLILRNGRNPGSEAVFFGINHQRELIFSARRSEGGVMKEQRIQPFESFPLWLKLVRKGEAVLGYWSSNGVVWDLFWFSDLMLDDPFLAGVGLASGRGDVLSAAVFDQVTQFKRIAPGMAGSKIPRIQQGGDPAKDLASAGEGLKLFISGQVHQSYQIECSENLRDWSVLTTVETGEFGGGFYRDHSSIGEGQRFYRARGPAGAAY
jgi:hypothetical protein